MDNQTMQKIISELQERACIIPLSVSKTKDYSSQSSQDIYIIQEKFLTLPENIKNKLVSSEIGDKIKEIGESYNLQFLQLADIARAIRSYYFGEIRLEDFPQILAREMPVDLRTAQEISQQVIKKIINDDSQERAYQAQLIKISLTDALQKYPETQEQLITSQLITTQSSSNPVRPTLKNWLSDYTYNLGYEAHSSIARGNYMFQNENTKTLSFEDRQRLSYILKSYDEKTPVTVDTVKKQIVFPVIEAGARPIPAPYAPPVTNSPAPVLIHKMDGASYSAKPSSSEVTNPSPANDFAKPFAREASKPAYNIEQDQPVSQPQPVKPVQKNLENNYDYYKIPQKQPSNSAPLSSSGNIKFSSPQKLPFEREKEKDKKQGFFQSRIPAAPPTTPMPPAPPKPIAPQRPPAPIGPQPLRIAPATPFDEEVEELPKNVVNLKE